MSGKPLSNEFILRCRQHLLDLKQELLNRQNQLRLDLASIEPVGSEEGDQSIHQIIEHQLHIAHNRTRSLMYEVEKALERISIGIFGMCEETGEWIETGRLEIMPYTRYSAEGAEIRDTKRYMMS